MFFGLIFLKRISLVCVNIILSTTPFFLIYHLTPYTKKRRKTVETQEIISTHEDEFILKIYISISIRLKKSDLLTFDVTNSKSILI